MNELRRQQQGVANPMTEEQILAEVLGTRRGFNRGRGHIVPGTARYHSSSSSPGTSNTMGRVYTQAEVEAMMAKSERAQARLNSQLQSIVNGLSKHNIMIEWEDEEEEEEEEEEQNEDESSD
jgi:hypothetical protein